MSSPFTLVETPVGRCMEASGTLRVAGGKRHNFGSPQDTGDTQHSGSEGGWGVEETTKNRPGHGDSKRSEGREGKRSHRCRRKTGKPSADGPRGED